MRGVLAITSAGKWRPHDRSYKGLKRVSNLAVNARCKLSSASMNESPRTAQTTKQGAQRIYFDCDDGSIRLQSGTMPNEKAQKQAKPRTKSQPPSYGITKWPPKHPSTESAEVDNNFANSFPNASSLRLGLDREHALFDNRADELFAVQRQKSSRIRPERIVQLDTGEFDDIIEPAGSDGDDGDGSGSLLGVVTPRSLRRIQFQPVMMPLDEDDENFTDERGM
jgi:hypothetical protein